MIHLARPIITPVANIVLCCFVFLDMNSGEGRTTCAKTMIPTGRDFGLAEWINCKLYFQLNELRYYTVTRTCIPCKVHVYNCKYLQYFI